MNPQGSESNLSMPKLHEDHIADKGIDSINRYNLVQKFVPMLQAMKIPDPKAAVDKGWKKLEATSAWQLKKVKSKKEVIKEAQKRQKESALCYIDGHVSSQKTQNWNRSIRSTKVELYFVATSSKTTQERTHSLFHWNILMSQGQLIQIWTLHKKNGWTIIGMSMKTEVCQIRGQVSRNLLCWHRHT